MCYTNTATQTYKFVSKAWQWEKISLQLFAKNEKRFLKAGLISVETCALCDADQKCPAKDLLIAHMTSRQGEGKEPCIFFCQARLNSRQMQLIASLHQ